MTKLTILLGAVWVLLSYFSRSKHRKWSEDELMVIAFYVLYERSGKNKSLICRSISEITAISYVEICRKTSVFLELKNKPFFINIRERKIYNNFNQIGRELSSKKVDVAIENILRNSKI